MLKVFVIANDIFSTLGNFKAFIFDDSFGVFREIQGFLKV